MKKCVLTALAAGLCCAVTTFSQVPSYVPTSGLMGWFPFNGNTNDESGSGNNGTIIGSITPSNDRFGVANKAYKFTGSGHVQLPSINLPSFTLNAWVKRLPTATGVAVICKHYSSSFNSSYLLFSQTASNNYCTPWIYFTNTSNVAASIEATGTTWCDNNWHMLTGVLSATSLKIYFDGVLITSSTGGVAKSTSFATLIGGQYSNSGVVSNQNFGDIDDVGFWNRDLTQSEITALYNSCSAPIAAITPQSSTSFCQGGSVTLQATTGSGYTYQWYNNGTAIQNATQSSYQATTSGNYTVMVTNGACNTTSAATVVTVNSNPTAVITPSGNTTFCQGGSVSLQANTGTGYTYEWYKNGVFISGASQSSYIATTSGNYTVKVIDGSCNATSSAVTVTVNTNPTVSLASIGAFTNYYATPVTLSGSPTGGTFSGAGVSGNTFNPQQAGLGATSINYSYTNASNCSGSASTSTIVYDTLGNVCTTYDTLTVTVYDTLYTTVTDTLIINTTLSLAPPNDQNTILIYPNPTSDHITIDNGNYAAMAGYELRIENNAGQQVFQSTINQAQFYLDLSTWTGNGLYFVHLIDPSGATVTVRKIVLQ
jgi:hypothetical protein